MEKAISIDKMRLMEKRFELVTAYRYKDRHAIASASKAIDRIREKAGKGKKSMTVLIRKWRDARYGPTGT